MTWKVNLVAPLISAPFSTAEPAATNTEFIVRIIPLRNSSGQPVELRNHPGATNVSLRQLVLFLRTNPVNYATFQPGKFVCTEFAQALHNAAEAAGLRAGVVMVDFTRGEGHVLNAFETTDKGVVYVDCTGGLPGAVPRQEFDTFGYLQTGKPYGRLPLDIGFPDPNHYSRYEQVDRIWTKMEIDQAQLEERRKRAADEARAVREAAQKLGPPPWPPERRNEVENLEKRRANLQKEELALRQEWEELRQRQKQWRFRVYHSNTNPVVRFKTWW
ncbi:cell division protein ZapB [Fontisphaera persica]|uniref:cell division protein ZapB n=1 Tax=Fontisphaera persica TaxID=2974023 RepID=UPI0024C0E4D8|nr:cell division protein ZapB [Fontisphaera persica]WCJ59828.1 cell division protein ZapB [Fontisphaera persica]